MTPKQQLSKAFDDICEMRGYDPEEIETCEHTPPFGCEHRSELLYPPDEKPISPECQRINELFTALRNLSEIRERKRKMLISMLSTRALIAMLTKER